MKAAGPPSPPRACATCPVQHSDHLLQLGVDMASWDSVVALAGNPNTGKSTLFNRLTGLRQHTGNWPGKTVSRAEGGFAFDQRRYKLIDLPGTYSLLSASVDEEIARDFLLFGRPDVTVVVVDATRLERNLNLALQVMDITPRVVICLNMMDEARRHGLDIDASRLSRALGVPVIPTAARHGTGIPALLQAISQVALGIHIPRPHRIKHLSPALEQAVADLAQRLEDRYPGLPQARWVAARLLDGDERVIDAVRSGELARLAEGWRPSAEPREGSGHRRSDGQDLLGQAEGLRWELGGQLHEKLVESIFSDAARIADLSISRSGRPTRFNLDGTLDRLFTSRLTGFPIMLLLFSLIFWITISGANLPSRWLSTALLDGLYPVLKLAAGGLGLPWWLSGVFIDGMYLSTAWVVSVMLPPMAIFFPLFTLLEDFGYLPRVAFNLDKPFRQVGAHGKQALSMMMGYGCNAAGVVAARIIDSPRERLIAILTNNFALCNGRWPTQILIAGLFLGAVAPAHLAGLASTVAVVCVVLIGVALTFALSWALSHTWLKGEVSTFSIELPPYRPPRLLQTIYTSLIDRTAVVLGRAVVFALPAGAVIWISANLPIGGASLAEHLIAGLDPVGWMIGLNGVILLAYLVAIPANEIVIPTVLMLTVLVTGIGGHGQEAGVLFDLESRADLLQLLTAGGWTMLTGVNLMLFSLAHNPCSTTLYTIYKETGSLKWTAAAALLPLAIGLMLTFFVAQGWRLLFGMG
jgi:ferrous iron transport protein B